MTLSNLNIQINSVTDLPAAAKQLIDFAGLQRIVLLYGDMGAGKTTFTKELCKALGSNDDVTSPTFSIVDEHIAHGETIYHFDFYRLKNEHEALDMGYEEYLYSGAWCFIEWPEKITGLLPQHYLQIDIKVTGTTTREIIARHI